MLRIALNGFGRIGKNFVRTLFTDSQALQNITLVAINVGNADPEALVYGLTYDSVYGRFNAQIAYSERTLTINGKKIQILSELDPAKIAWKQLAIDWVVEVTGKFTDAQKAGAHLTAGAQKVLISAPAQGEDVAIIPGVNEQKFNAQQHRIISLGSCTTNAVIPLLDILHREGTIEYAHLLTTHAYTNTQKLLDVDAQMTDVRKSRAAAINIIPSTTGAVEMVGKIIPDLQDKVVGYALRVPVADVSFLQLTCVMNRPVARDRVLEAFSRNKYIALEQNELVSSDFIGNPYSASVDIPLFQATGRNLSVAAWYDNEAGYSHRLKDFLLYVLQK